MANRVVPAALDADNSAGSFSLAACNDWRSTVRRFHVGTGLLEPTSDAEYTTAGSPYLPQLSINLFLCGGSPYTWLDRTLVSTCISLGIGDKLQS
jgi:hypothetical protein